MIVCCKGWGALLCLLDNLVHVFRSIDNPTWLCRAHDRYITRGWEDQA